MGLLESRIRRQNLGMAKMWDGLEQDPSEALSRFPVLGECRETDPPTLPKGPVCLQPGPRQDSEPWISS